MPQSTHFNLQLHAAAAFLLLGCGLGCAREPDGKIPKENEVVMEPLSRIDATTPVGEISITAGKGLRRTYEWEGAARSVDMWPRSKRWYGSMGLYYPGPGNHWPEHNGVTRGVVEEGQQHFKTEADALAWLNKDTYHPIVWNNEGLVVGWSKTLPRRQLNVDVWQIYIDGKRPTRLEGASDEAIKYRSPE
jgi:hypothetical protein